ncbi:DUF2680 domain-containing protein [Fervidibacillus halotolerans]|uniref:YckD family protein n=1 Tax=Fervidibacillus halotolerans TaxID=2980027 RepID=A0A9E8S0Y1_9BACI|nr:DUF2680 domain-containing protein [Fervidibacillus halotolerans]WAA12977.1 YckD family protein [Fervidibacillus halotolerans]
MKGKAWFIPVIVVAFLGMGVVFSSQFASLVSANDNLSEEVVEKTESLPCVGNGIGKGRQFFDESIRETVAEVLQMSPNELFQERMEGKTLAEIAEEQGVSEEDLLSVMMEVREKQLEQLVEDGVITEEQKEIRMENMDKRLMYVIENGRDVRKERGKCLKNVSDENGDKYQHRFKNGNV